MGGNVPTEFWGFNGTAPDNKENEPFLKWLMVVAGVRVSMPSFAYCCIRPALCAGLGRCT